MHSRKRSVLYVEPGFGNLNTVQLWPSEADAKGLPPSYPTGQRFSVVHGRLRLLSFAVHGLSSTTASILAILWPGSKRTPLATIFNPEGRV